MSLDWPKVDVAVWDLHHIRAVRLSRNHTCGEGWRAQHSDGYRGLERGRCASQRRQYGYRICDRALR